MLNTIQWPGQQELQAWRHDFHRHPETAFQEHRTSARVVELLTSFGLEVHTGLAGTGVVAVLKGNMGDGPSIGLRADMDALHVTELNTCEHASQNAGRMHACGHDGHTSMLLGAAKTLAAHPDFKGTVHFIFQPAEENEGGARAMIADGNYLWNGRVSQADILPDDMYSLGGIAVYLGYDAHRGQHFENDLMGTMRKARDVAEHLFYGR